MNGPFETLKETVLAELPSGDHVITRLRLRHVGSVVDTDKLTEEQFSCVESTDGGWCRWEREFHPGYQRLRLDVAPGGMLCTLRMAEFLDVQAYDGIGAPYGWYQQDDTDARSETLLSEVLSRTIASSPPDDPDDEWAFLLQRVLRYDPAQWANEEPLYIICCYADHFYSNPRARDPRVATLLVVAMARHISAITNPHVLHDIPFLSGRLRLRGECSKSIRRVFDLGLDLEAPGWSNMGAVLCDALRRPAAALACFEHATAKDPSLGPPRQAAWIAGRDLMGIAIKDRKLVDIPEICERVSAIGDSAQAHHGFWGYSGLGYEFAGDNKKALQCYRKALSIDSDCSTAQLALDRLGAAGKPTLEMQLESMRSKIEYSYLEKDD
jgi:tetratricopeptide (TPR) repeat protein